MLLLLYLLSCSYARQATYTAFYLPSLFLLLFSFMLPSQFYMHVHVCTV